MPITAKPTKRADPEGHCDFKVVGDPVQVPLMNYAKDANATHAFRHSPSMLAALPTIEWVHAESGRMHQYAVGQDPTVDPLVRVQAVEWRPPGPVRFKGSGVDDLWFKMGFGYGIEGPPGRLFGFYQCMRLRAQYRSAADSAKWVPVVTNKPVTPPKSVHTGADVGFLQFDAWTPDDGRNVDSTGKHPDKSRGWYTTQGADRNTGTAIMTDTPGFQAPVVMSSSGFIPYDTIPHRFQYTMALALIFASSIGNPPPMVRKNPAQILEFTMKFDFRTYFVDADNRTIFGRAVRSYELNVFNEIESDRHPEVLIKPTAFAMGNQWLTY